MNYVLSMTRRSQTELSALIGGSYNQVIQGMDRLRTAPRGPGCRKMRGREAWRLRVGRFRVIYEIDDAMRTVLILRVGHRREIYR